MHAWSGRVGLVLLPLLASIAVAEAGLSGPRPPSQDTAPVTAFVGVTVVPADRERLIENQTVLVRGGRIAALGATAKVQIPTDARRVDGTGKFLMPGIAEMHGHLPGPNVPDELVQRTLKLFVANGVTTVRGMQGAANQFALRERIRRGEWLGPRLFLYGPPLSGQEIPTPESGERQVRAHKQAGYDGLKIHEDLSLPTYEAIARTAKQLQMPFGGHVPNQVGLERALTAGQKSIDHLDGYLEALAPEVAPVVKGNRLRLPAELLERLDERRIARLVSATRRAKAVVVPTMAVWRTLFGDATAASLARLPELKYEPNSNLWIEEKREMEATTPLQVQQQRKWMKARDHVLKAIADAGGMIVLGADSPQLFSVPGFSLHNETQAMVDAGMTPWQVVQAATFTPARYLVQEREIGTVAVGKRADLLLVDGNPLQDVANIFRTSGVMVNGRWLARAELDQMLAEIEGTASVLRYPAASSIQDLPIRAQEATPVTGKYAFPNGDLVAISLEQSGLLATPQGAKAGKSWRLLSQGGGTYLIPEIKAKITFEPGTAGGTPTLVFGQNGARIEGIRRPADSGPPPKPAPQ